MVRPALTRLGPFDDPKPRATYALPIQGLPASYGSGDVLWGGLECYGEMNSHVEPPVLWLVPSAGAGIQLYEERDGKLNLKRDLGAEARKRIGKTALPEYWRQRLFVNPNQNARKANSISGLPIYNGTGWHKGGMSISVKGHLVISCYVTKGDFVAPVGKRTDANYVYWGASARKKATPDQKGIQGLAFPIRHYPGRLYFGEIHV